MERKQFFMHLLFTEYLNGATVRKYIYDPHADWVEQADHTNTQNYLTYINDQSPIEIRIDHEQILIRCLASFGNGPLPSQSTMLRVAELCWKESEENCKHISQAYRTAFKEELSLLVTSAAQK